MNVTPATIDELTRLLGARLEQTENESVLSIGGGEAAPAIVLTITLLADRGAVLSAQTVHGYFELHDVDRVVPVEEGEVIFVAEEGSKISGLVVGREATCSLFANVDRSTLSADFTVLEPALLLAAMQLGLAENISA